MRRDVCYTFPVSVDLLYNAYFAAATNDRFRRDCTTQPFHTLSFGLNASVIYNFNGGACTLRFMPYGNGSAVNMRFSIAQLMGARYEKYAQDLTDEVARLLQVGGQRANVDVDLFMRPENQVCAGVANPVPAPTPVPAPAQGQVCCQCGRAVGVNDKFCAGCGTAVVRKRFCSACGKEQPADAAFCSACGNRI